MQRVNKAQASDLLKIQGLELGRDFDYFGLVFRGSFQSPHKNARIPIKVGQDHFLPRIMSF
jgi:hypothetical protein